MASSDLSFLDVEAAFERLIVPAVSREAERVASAAGKALDRDGEDAALDAVRSFSLKTALGRAKGKARVLAVNALVLGAVTAGADPDQTVFEEEGLPDVLGTALEAYLAIVGTVLEDYVVEAGELLVDRTVREQRDAGFVSKAADPDFVARLNEAVDGGGRMMASIGANLTTSRLVTYGFLSQAVKKGVEVYQLNAILDGKTSKICRALDGRVFRVEGALEHVRHVLQITDPEGLKAASPWLRGDKATVEDLKTSTSQALAEKYGVMVPPFHARCRTILSLVEKAVNEGSPPSPATGGLPLTSGFSDNPDKKAIRAAHAALPHYVDDDGDSPLAKAADAYIGPAYKEINSAVRGGTPLSAKNQEVYDLLTAGAKPLSEPTVVYRGVDIPVSVSVGDTIKTSGLTSTSGDLKISARFARVPGDGGDSLTLETMYVMKLPKGYPALPINADELEFVLGDGSEFRVVSVQQDVEGALNWSGGVKPATIRRVVTLEPVS